MSNQYPLAIIGAGPAGLTAAYEAVRCGVGPIVLEQAAIVGGLARTESYKGYRFDIGGHRFFTKVKEVQQLWEDLLGEQFVRVPRLSRIYYRDRFYNYPLDLVNALTNLGLVESLLIVLSYLKWQLAPYPVEETFEQWVTNRFGRRLYETFFKTYTEKVWGIPCDKIRADWAAQRIRGLSLMAAVSSALFGRGGAKSLITEFDYPVLGPGMMWERFREEVEGLGAEVRLQARVVRLMRHGGRVVEVVAEQNGEILRIPAEQVISSMPLGELILRIEPGPPSAVIEGARGLRYRALLLVALVVRGARPFPDNWIYVHSPQVQVGRIQNYKNWSAAMVPDPTMTCLGMEYFCSEGDGLWQTPDAHLIELASHEVDALGLARADDVEDGVVIRQPKAYPVYDEDYGGHLQVIREFLATLDNVQTIGRNGMHRYNNQDHSMLTGILAVRNLMGGQYNLWEVNESAEYLEEAASRS